MVSEDRYFSQIPGGKVATEAIFVLYLAIILFWRRPRVSPVGHTSTGISLYLTYCYLKKKQPSLYGFAGAVFLSICPDLDMIAAIWNGLHAAVQYHQTYTHTFVFAIVISLMTGVCHWIVSGRWCWPWVASSMGFITLHLLADTVTRYKGVEGGVRLFWPFSDYHVLGPSVFLEIYGTSWTKLFSLANLKATIHELLLFLPLLSWSVYLVFVKDYRVKLHEETI